MNRWREILVVVVVLTGPITQVFAGWQNNAANYYRTNSTTPSAGITEQKAIALAQQHFKGRVLAVSHSDDVYRIKILSQQGTIHIILINALDGTIISTH